MAKERRLIRRRLSRLALACALAYPAAAVAITDSEVISLTGLGEERDTGQSDWRVAAIHQRVPVGGFVRTGERSQMALLLGDQTQLRLNQNSMVQVKALATASSAGRLLLSAGRAWMQTKGKPVQTASGSSPRLLVETPNAIAAIRGTDWELEVEPDGATLLTVLSGEVEFYNEYGRVSVLPNEQARVAPGKAPVKLLLTEPSQRVQWVTAYRPQPTRWMRTSTPETRAAIDAIEQGRYSDATLQLGKLPESADALLLQADLLLAQGLVEQASSVIRTGQQHYPQDGRLAALGIRAAVIDGKEDEARRQADEAVRAYPQEIEVWIAAGDFARYQGDAESARRAYGKALQLDAGDPFAWYGLGVVSSEREAVKPAMHDLGEALRLDPNGPGFRGELATLLTFVDRFPEADAAFHQSLDGTPDDYVALTGLGLLQLKRGETQDALDSFLRAGVMEPRYARAVLYTGVAYYQLEQRDRALEMFQRAAKLDPRDPLPWVMIGLTASDRLDWGEAVSAARAAKERLPFLKSLNQVQTNQRGNANLGSALASFGLEEWAQTYALDAYTPYWAGSHLFLADRFLGSFNKNSELFQGYLTDPTVFGAANRFSTLVPKPGDHVTFSATAAHQHIKGAELQTELNGYHNSVLPFAYYLSLDSLKLSPASNPTNGDQNNLTVGLGSKPSYDTAGFLFGTRNLLSANFTDNAAGLPGNPVTQQTSRVDAGFNLKFTPESQAWFKVGAGETRSHVGGEIISPVLGSFLGVSSTGEITAHQSNVRVHDWQWRHSIDMGAHRVSWGAEYGYQDKPVSLAMAFFPFDVTLSEDTRYTSRDAYVSDRFRINDQLMLQGDLAWQAYDKHFERVTGIDFFGIPIGSDPESDDKHFRELNPRLGAAWQVQPGQTLRLAWQQWRRPMGVATLGQVDTAGIPLDDRLVAVGGRLKRLRGQMDWERSPQTFVQFYLDHRDIDNVMNPGGNLASDFELSELERLRQLANMGRMQFDFYEDTAEFSEGRIRSVGAAINHIWSPHLSGELQYDLNDGKNTSSTYAGNRIPFLPRHTLQLRTTWLAAPRFQVTFNATYRSARYRDEANTAKLDAGWNFSLFGYWESDDKKLSVAAGFQNLLSKKTAGAIEKPIVGVQLVWRP